MDTIQETVDLLLSSQPRVEHGGYVLYTAADWQNIVQEWYEAHPDWTVAQLYIGIKYYNYMFPHRVSLEMVHNAENWTK